MIIVFIVRKNSPLAHKQKLYLKKFILRQGFPFIQNKSSHSTRTILLDLTYIGISKASHVAVLDTIATCQGSTSSLPQPLLY